MLHDVIPISQCHPPPSQRFPKSAGFLKRRDRAVHSCAATSSTWLPCSASPFTTVAARATTIASRISPLARSTAVHEKVSTNLFTLRCSLWSHAHWHHLCLRGQHGDYMVKREGTNKHAVCNLVLLKEIALYLQYEWKQCLIMPLWASTIDNDSLEKGKWWKQWFYFWKTTIWRCSSLCLTSQLFLCCAWILWTKGGVQPPFLAFTTTQSPRCATSLSTQAAEGAATILSPGRAAWACVSKVCEKSSPLNIERWTLEWIWSSRDAVVGLNLERG